MTKCDRGRGVKIGQNSVTYFMDGPYVELRVSAFSIGLFPNDHSNPSTNPQRLLRRLSWGCRPADPYNVINLLVGWHQPCPSQFLALCFHFCDCISVMNNITCRLSLVSGIGVNPGELGVATPRFWAGGSQRGCRGSQGGRMGRGRVVK